MAAAHALDAWSLGVTLLEFLTGTAPAVLFTGTPEPTTSALYTATADQAKVDSVVASVRSTLKDTLGGDAGAALAASLLLNVAAQVLRVESQKRVGTFPELHDAGVLALASARGKGGTDPFAEVAVRRSKRVQKRKREEAASEEGGAAAKKSRPLGARYSVAGGPRHYSTPMY
jgi:hypothetical protein